MIFFLNVFLRRLESFVTGFGGVKLVKQFRLSPEDFSNFNTCDFLGGYIELMFKRFAFVEDHAQAF